MSALANLPSVIRQGVDLFQQGAPLIAQIGGLFSGNRQAAGAPAATTNTPAPMPDAPSADAGTPAAPFAAPATAFSPADPQATPATTSPAPSPTAPAPPVAAPANPYPSAGASQPSAPVGPPAPLAAPANGYDTLPSPGFAPQPGVGQPTGFSPQNGYGAQQPFGPTPSGFASPFGFAQQPTAFGLPGVFGQAAAGLGQFLQSAVPGLGHLPQTFDQIGNSQIGHLFNALRQGQIPPLPGWPARYAQPQQPAYTGFAQPAAPQGFDASALLRLIIGNPQFQQALQSAGTQGAAGARSIGLPVPYPGGVRTVQVPLGAAVSAVRELAESVLSELNASTREDEAEVPEYLVNDEGAFIVDPAIAEDRAALVAHLFKMSSHAPGHPALAEGGAGDQTEDVSEINDIDEANEAEAWARDAGFGASTHHSERSL